MTPLGRGILTGMCEVDDPLISDAMTKMINASSRQDVNQTMLEMGALVTALCGAVADGSNTTSQDVLACVLSR
jgi:hypothetical protein